MVTRLVGTPSDVTRLMVSPVTTGVANPVLGPGLARPVTAVTLTVTAGPDEGPTDAADNDDVLLLGSTGLRLLPWVTHNFSVRPRPDPLLP